jgi:hypothetical protein
LRIKDDKYHGIMGIYQMKDVPNKREFIDRCDQFRLRAAIDTFGFKNMNEGGEFYDTQKFGSFRMEERGKPHQQGMGCSFLRPESPHGRFVVRFPDDSLWLSGHEHWRVPTVG